MDSRELRFVNDGTVQGNPPDLVQGNVNTAVQPLSNTLLLQGELDHVQVLSNQFKTLLQSEDFSDVTFLVEGKKFFCHKVILAARCEYFRALLFGGMKESNTNAGIALIDTSAASFSVLLEYLYTGTIALKDLKEENVIDLLGLANRYGLLKLQNSIGAYLELRINIKNVSLIYDVSCLYSLHALRDNSLKYMDHNAMDILETEGFTNLSEQAVTTILSRDSFCAPEVKIFKAVAKWIDINIQEGTDYKHILNVIRLPLISLQDLFHGVRESQLYPSDVILDAIQMKTEYKVNDMPFRGHLGKIDFNIDLLLYCKYFLINTA